MEAEGRRDKVNENLNPIWMKSRILSNVTAKQIFVNKNFRKISVSGQAKDEENIPGGRKEFASSENIKIIKT